MQLQQVGQGSFGRVIHAAVLHSGEPVDVAIKLLPRGQQVSTLLTRALDGQSVLIIVSLLCCHGNSAGAVAGCNAQCMQAFTCYPVASY